MICTVGCLSGTKLGIETYITSNERLYFSQSVDISKIIIKGLVTNYGEGGATKREGGAREVLPLRKGGAEKVLAMLKGGHKRFWGSL